MYNELLQVLGLYKLLVKYRKLNLNVSLRNAAINIPNKNDFIVTCFLSFPFLPLLWTILRSSPLEVFLRKDVLNICSRLPREHLYLRAHLESCFRTLAVFTADCLEDYYKKGQSEHFWGNLRPLLGKLVSQLLTKKNDLLYMIWFSYHVFKYSIVYIDENWQTAIIFNNLGN